MPPGYRALGVCHDNGVITSGEGIGRRGRRGGDVQGGGEGEMGLLYSPEFFLSLTE